MSKRVSNFDRANLKSRQVAKAVEDSSVQKRRINNDEPLRFPKNNETGFITNHELATDINTVMENIFQDYYGSIVSVVPNQAGRPGVRIELYFRPTSSETADGFVKAFRSLQLENPQTASLIDMVKLTNKVSSYDHSFELTQEAAEYLYDFLPQDAQKVVNWAEPSTFAKVVAETVESQYNNDKIIYCSIVVDVFKLLAFVYGRKEGNQKHGSKLTYEITPVRPAPNGGDPTAIGANWILSLSVMSDEAYQEVMSKLGVNFNQGRTPIVVTRKYCS